MFVIFNIIKKYVHAYNIYRCDLLIRVDRSHWSNPATVNRLNTDCDTKRKRLTFLQTYSCIIMKNKQN